MGAWGFGLFQSDNELDTMEEISSEAGRITHDPDFTFWYPENKPETVAKLNDGLFHQLVEKFQIKQWKHGIIYLGALSMQLGVKITEEDMQILRDTLKRVKMFGEAKAQMKKGLDGYKNNGEEWDFGSPGIEETASLKPDSGNPGGFGMLNVFRDWSKEPQPMPKDGEVAKDDSETEDGTKTKKENKSKKPTGKGNLGSKDILKAFFGS